MMLRSNFCKRDESGDSLNFKNKGLKRARRVYAIFKRVSLSMKPFVRKTNGFEPHGNQG